MITIKDIYQWYKNAKKNTPYPSINLTPLQRIEWEEENDQRQKDHIASIEGKSFVGEILVDAPAKIQFITKEEINAVAEYLWVYSDGGERSAITAEYEIYYSESLYNEIRMIHSSSMIKFSGKITHFNKHSKKVTIARANSDYNYSYDCYNFKINLSSIKVINKHEEKLYLHLLSDEVVDYVQERKRKAVIEYSKGYRFLWMTLCGLIGGVSGCYSCVFYNEPRGSFDLWAKGSNLFTGAIIGVALGYLLGYVLAILNPEKD